MVVPTEEIVDRLTDLMRKLTIFGLVAEASFKRNGELYFKRLPYFCPCIYLQKIEQRYTNFLLPFSY